MKINNIKAILKNSSKAVCGITEREVVVPAKNVAPTIKKLKDAGYYVVGTGYNKAPTKKIWFIRRGGL